MVVTGANISASISASNSINACVNKKTGVIRQLTKGKCTSNETALTWNKAGVQGAQGLQGPQGTQGAQGAQGARGPAGQDAPAHLAISAKRTFYGVIQAAGCTDPLCHGTQIWNLAENGVITDKTASDVVVPSQMLVQSMAAIRLRAITDQTLDAGYVYCYVVATDYANPSYSYALGNAYANISDVSLSTETRTTAVAVGAATLPAGRYDVAITCTVTGSQAEIATAGVMVNLTGTAS